MKIPTGIDTSAQKKAALSFLRLVVSGKVHEAYDACVGPGFRHHNPYFRGDAKSLETGMTENALANPEKNFAVQRVLEERDLVGVHSRVRLKAGGPELSVVHIFRFDNGRIVELWDIGQPVPSDSPNENGMF